MDDLRTYIFETSLLLEKEIAPNSTFSLGRNPGQDYEEPDDLDDDDDDEGYSKRINGRGSSTRVSYNSNAVSRGVAPGF